MNTTQQWLMLLFGAVAAYALAVLLGELLGWIIRKCTKKDTHETNDR
jgi:ABC-type proline/glycine betaine transport system permease subunit